MMSWCTKILCVRALSLYLKTYKLKFVVFPFTTLASNFFLQLTWELLPNSFNSLKTVALQQVPFLLQGGLMSAQRKGSAPLRSLSAWHRNLAACFPLASVSVSNDSGTDADKHNWKTQVKVLMNDRHLFKPWKIKWLSNLRMFLSLISFSFSL